MRLMQQKNKVKNFTWWLPSRPEQIGKNVSAFQCSSQAKIKSAAGFPKQNTSHSSLPACLLFLCSVDKMVSAVDNVYIWVFWPSILKTHWMRLLYNHPCLDLTDNKESVFERKTSWQVFSPALTTRSVNYPEQGAQSWSINHCMLTESSVETETSRH